MEAIRALASAVSSSPVGGSLREAVEAALAACETWSDDVRRNVAKRNSSRGLAESLHLILASLRRAHELVHTCLQVCQVPDTYLWHW